MCIFFAVCPAYCTTYFVQPDGSDSNSGTTINSAFKTITKAVGLAQLAAGDTIYLRGGTHGYTTTISISKSGASGNPITLQNYQNENVIVDFTGQPYGTSSRGISLGGSYWHFKGFTIQYAGDNGLYIAGSYNVAEQIVSRMNSDSGIQLHEEGSYNLVLNCDSYLNYDAPNGGENADGFAVKSSTIGPGNIFRGCRSWNNADDGFDLYYTQNVIRFEDCWAFGNGVNRWGLSTWNGDGNGFKLGLSAGNHVLIRCIAYNHPHNGIDINGDTLPVEVYNCTTVSNAGKNFYFDEHIASVLRNNISHRGSVNIYAEVDDLYNSWNGFTVTDADFASLDSNGIDGPRQSDGNLPVLNFLHLATGSDLIDGGTNVGLPYNGSAPDLGCYEYSDSGVDYPPAAPTGLSATGYNGSVGLDWDDNGESDLDGYNIYRSTTSGSGYSKLNSSLLSNSNYTDDSVINNTTYYYVVTAVDVNEHESGYSSQSSATPADTNAPATPTGLEAAAGDQIVLLGWNANSESDLAGYNIYRSTTSGSGYIKLNSSLLIAPDYNDSNVTNTITYYYVVTAVDTSSNESAHSSEVTAIPTIYGDFIVNGIVETDDLGYLCDLWLVNDCEATSLADLDDDCSVNFYEFSAFANNWMIIPPDINAPAAPTGFSADAGDATVSLNWNDNAEGDLDGYNIYRSTTSGSGYSQLNGSLLSSSDYTDNSVTNGTTYYYVVTAVDTSSNESAYSSQVSATPAAPVTSITIQENTDGFCSVDPTGTIDNNNDGYTGTGFVNTQNATGEGINWSINILTAGTYTFTWRYSCTSVRPGNLLVNGSTVLSGISFPATSSFTEWTTVTTSGVTLTTGVKTIRLEATTSGGLANIDYMMVTGPNLTTATCQ
ncbi:MAG: right-handed parallel beta-helix repeat-containing protein [Sedimentisphaerales bacterium]